MRPVLERKYKYDPIEKHPIIAGAVAGCVEGAVVGVFVGGLPGAGIGAGIGGIAGGIAGAIGEAADLKTEVIAGAAALGVVVPLAGAALGAAGCAIAAKAGAAVTVAKGAAVGAIAGGGLAAAAAVALPATAYILKTENEGLRQRLADYERRDAAERAARPAIGPAGRRPRSAGEAVADPIAPARGGAGLFDAGARLAEERELAAALALTMDKFRCTHSRGIMVDPVLGNDGYHYERTVLEALIAGGAAAGAGSAYRSPKNPLIIVHAYFSNVALREEIETFFADHPEMHPDHDPVPAAGAAAGARV